MMTAQQRSGDRLIEVGNGIFVWRGEGLGPNSGFIISDDAVMVIDSLVGPGLAREVLAQVQRVTTKEVRYLVNTHHHGDHVLGNIVFASAHIIAHYKCRQIMAESWPHMVRSWSQLRPDLAEDLAGAQITLPDITFSDRFTLYMDGRQLEFMYTGHGHTPDDIVLYLPQDRVLFAADLLFAGMFPFMRDSNSQGWIDALDKILPLEATTVVPGHGPVSKKDELLVQREFMTTLRGMVLACFQQGMSDEEAVRSLQLKGYEHWLGQERLPLCVSRIYAELRGEIR